MVKGFCPTCQNDLSNEENVIVTNESEIFKGHNVYVMCKECGLVMVYNKKRGSLFSLDRFKDDDEVVKEIQHLLEEQTAEEIEVQTIDEEPSCCGDCANCTKNCEEVKTIEEYHKVDEQVKSKETVDLNDVLYMVHKRTDERRFISVKDLNLIENLNEWLFYAFQSVEIEPVVSYKIHRV